MIKLESVAGILEFSTEGSVPSRIVVYAAIPEIRMVRSNFGSYVEEVLPV